MFVKGKLTTHFADSEAYLQKKAVTITVDKEIYIDSELIARLDLNLCMFRGYKPTRNKRNSQSSGLYWNDVTGTDNLIFFVEIYEHRLMFAYFMLFQQAKCAYDYHIAGTC